MLDRQSFRDSEVKKFRSSWITRIQSSINRLQRIVDYFKQLLEHPRLSDRTKERLRKLIERKSNHIAFLNEKIALLEGTKPNSSVVIPEGMELTFKKEIEHEKSQQTGQWEEPIKSLGDRESTGHEQKGWIFRKP